MVQYWGLLYILKNIRTKLISCQHNDLLIEYFEIDKTQELTAKKYYYSTFRHNMETYLRGYNICLISKALYHKFCEDLQLLPVQHIIRKIFNRLCNRFTIVYQIEKWQLWLDLYHCQLLDQNSIIQISPSYHQYSKTNIGHYWHSDVISRLFQLYHWWPQSDFNIQVLLFALLLSWYQKTTIYHISSLNKWAN